MTFGALLKLNEISHASAMVKHRLAHLQHQPTPPRHFSRTLPTNMSVSHTCKNAEGGGLMLKRHANRCFTMVEAWEISFNFNNTPNVITRVETRGTAALKEAKNPLLICQKWRLRLTTRPPWMLLLPLRLPPRPVATAHDPALWCQDICASHFPARLTGDFVSCPAAAWGATSSLLRTSGIAPSPVDRSALALPASDNPARFLGLTDALCADPSDPDAFGAPKNSFLIFQKKNSPFLTFQESISDLPKNGAWCTKKVSL